MRPSDLSGVVRASEAEISAGASRLIGRYRIVGELGEGGMARVYLAVLHANGGFRKFVVLKVPNDAIVQDPTLLAMFLDEARLAARLNHQNVVQTYEVIDENARPILVMEYLAGRSLAQIRARSRTLGQTFPLAMHLRVIAESLNGLHHAHELRDFDGQPLHLVHRDVSPQNVMVTFDGNVKVLDFGVAKAGLWSQETATGTFKGKIRYMSPEQLRDASTDRRADIFSAGAMVWEAAVGRRLWEASTPDKSVVQALMTGAIPMPRDVRPDVDPRLETIIRRALAVDPSDRYPTAAALQSALEAYLEEQPQRFTTKQVGAHAAELFAEQHARMTRDLEARFAHGAPMPLEGTKTQTMSVVQADRTFHEPAESRSWVQSCSAVRPVSPPMSSLAPTTTAAMPAVAPPTQNRSMPFAMGAVAVAIAALVVLSYSVVRSRDVVAQAAAHPALTRFPAAEKAELPWPLPAPPPEELVSPSPALTQASVPTRAVPAQAAPRRVEAPAATPATAEAARAVSPPAPTTTTTTRPRVKLVEDKPPTKLLD